MRASPIGGYFSDDLPLTADNARKSDTVPFTMWCAARHLHDYEQAMWTTVSGLGDRDTTCAIIGGIVALSPLATIPATWQAAREPLEVMADP